MDVKSRKPNRLNGYDYSQSGAYFITICLDARRRLLWRRVGANCVRPNSPLPLSELGVLIDREIQKINNIYDNVTVNKYCIMPEHIHLILMISSGEDGRTQFAPTVSRVIKQFKGSISKQTGQRIWQKSFHDHIIRNEEEYLEIWTYIDSNPMIWREDTGEPYLPGETKNTDSR